MDIEKTISIQETIDSVESVVCEHFGLNPSQLSEANQSEFICIPKQIAWYLSRKLGDCARAPLARHYNKHVHTIGHGCQAVEDRISTNSRFRAMVELLEFKCAERINNYKQNVNKQIKLNEKKKIKLVNLELISINDNAMAQILKFRNDF